MQIFVSRLVSFFGIQETPGELRHAAVYAEKNPDRLKSSKGIADEFTVFLPNIISYKYFITTILDNVICSYLKITAH